MASKFISGRKNTMGNDPEQLGSGPIKLLAEAMIG